MKSVMTMAACAALLAFASPASAYSGQGQEPISIDTTKSIVPSATFQLARRGADDPAGDDRGGGRGKGGRGRGGHDDGPNHT